MSALNICNGSMEAGFRSVFPKNRVKSAIFPPPSDTNSLRCLNQSFRFRHVAKILRRHYLQPLSFSSHWMEHSKRTLGLMDNGHSLEDSLHNDISFPNTGPSGSVKGNEILLSDIYKFTVLTGLLIFQGSQAANAGSEFTGAQPISFIGDLGDISTGLFADLLL